MMKKTISILSLVLALSLFSNVQAQDVSEAIAKNIQVTEFAEKIASFDNEQILDVRTPGEWATGVIEGAEKINVMDADFAAQAEKLDKDKPLMVYCRSGNRSGKAMKILQDLGFNEVYNLSGGITAWRANDKEIVK